VDTYLLHCNSDRGHFNAPLEVQRRTLGGITFIIMIELMQKHIEYGLLHFGIFATLKHFHQSYLLVLIFGGGGRNLSQSENRIIIPTIIQLFAYLPLLAEASTKKANDLKTEIPRNFCLLWAGGFL